MQTVLGSVNICYLIVETETMLFLFLLFALFALVFEIYFFFF